MKKVLYVEDDRFIARLYRQKLMESGFEVECAEDGLVAMRKLVEFKPDVMVLDLLMPKMTGADVLRFLRQKPELSSVRVIVFSNSFLSKLTQEVAAAGVERALVKAAVTPVKLVDAIHEVLDEPPLSAPNRSTVPAPASPPAPVTEQPPGGTGPPPDPTASGTMPVPQQASEAEKESELDFRERVRSDFFAKIPSITHSVRQLCHEFIEASDEAELSRRLEELRRKVGFLTEMTALAGCNRIAQLASALEALLVELREKPSLMSDSIRSTVATTAAFLTDQLELTEEPEDESPRQATALVVDDDAFTNRAVVMALNKAHLKAVGVTDPFEGLKALERTAYDLVLLDIDMPGMDGITLCQKMRALPKHKRTAVVFVTIHSDFKTRSRSLLSGGNDLITKPIVPMELTVKVISQLLQRPKPANSSSASSSAYPPHA